MTARRVRRALLLCIPLAVLLAAGGCLATDPGNIFQPKSDFTRTLADLFSFIIILAAIVFLVVEGLLVFAIIRYRQRPGHVLPRQIHGNTPLEIFLTILPAIVLAIIAVPTIQNIFSSYKQADASENPVVIDVIGHQWWWEYQFKDLKDSQGRVLTTAQELHIPVNRLIQVNITSSDVNHAWWAPQLAAKRDAIPGHSNPIKFKAEQTGRFLGRCAEYCGLSHANMGFWVVVESQQDFDNWVRQQQAPVPDTTSGATLFKSKECIACHRIEGISEVTYGPNLTLFGNRETLAGAALQNTEDEVVRWLKDPAAVKPGSKMPNLHLSDEDARALARYLRGLK